MPAIVLKSLPASLYRALKAQAARSRRANVEAMLADAQRFRDSLKFEARPDEIDAFKHEGRRRP